MISESVVFFLGQLVLQNTRIKTFLQKNLHILCFVRYVTIVSKRFAYSTHRVLKFKKLALANKWCKIANLMLSATIDLGGTECK